jgi:hypothetical protein
MTYNRRTYNAAQYTKFRQLPHNVIVGYTVCMTKPILVLKRHGNLAVARIDLVTERPLSMDSIDGETPPGCIDKPMPVVAAVANYGPHYTLQWLEPERGPEKIAENTVTDAEIQAILAARPEEQPAEAKPPITSAPPTLPQQGLIQPSQADVLVFRELEVMFAKRQVATGKTRKQLDAEIQAVANFLVRVFPQTLEPLQVLSQRYQEEVRVQF